MKYLALLLLSFSLSAFAQNDDGTRFGDSEATVRAGKEFIIIKNIKTHGDDNEGQIIMYRGKGKKIQEVRLLNHEKLGQSAEEIYVSYRMLHQARALNFEAVYKDFATATKSLELSNRKNFIRSLKSQTSIDTLTIDAYMARSKRDMNRQIDKAQNAYLAEDDKCKEKLLTAGSKIGPSLQKASAFITTHLTQATVAPTAFFSGLFNKKGSIQEKAMLQFLNSNIQNLNAHMMINQDIGTFELSDEIDILVANLLEDELDKNRKNINEISITMIEKYAVGEKLLASDINDHPDYQELKKLFGSITQNDLDAFIAMAEKSDKDVEVSLDTLLNNYDGEVNEKKLKTDGIVSGSLEIIAPAIVLGAVFGAGAGWATLGVTLAANITTMFTAKKCMQHQLFDNLSDKEAKFCGYILNRTGRHIGRTYIKARAKGESLRRKN